MKRLTQAVVALFVSLGVLLVGGAPAQAATGDVIVNMSASNGKVIIQNNGYNYDLWWGQISSYTIDDVDYFWVPGGCDAYSQYGYKYVGNKWYGPLPGNAYLKLTVKC
jgi:hypothetical protein